MKGGASAEQNEQPEEWVDSAPFDLLHVPVIGPIPSVAALTNDSWRFLCSQSVS